MTQELLVLQLTILALLVVIILVLVVFLIVFHRYRDENKFYRDRHEIMMESLLELVPRYVDRISEEENEN